MPDFFGNEGTDLNSSSKSISLSSKQGSFFSTYLSSSVRSVKSLFFGNSEVNLKRNIEMDDLSSNINVQFNRIADEYGCLTVENILPKADKNLEPIDQQLKEPTSNLVIKDVIKMIARLCLEISYIIERLKREEINIYTTSDESLFKSMKRIYKGLSREVQKENREGSYVGTAITSINTVYLEELIKNAEKIESDKIKELAKSYFNLSKELVEQVYSNKSINFSLDQAWVPPDNRSCHVKIPLPR